MSKNSNIRNLFKQGAVGLELPELNAEAEAAAQMDVSVVKNKKSLVTPRASGIYADCMRRYILARLNRVVIEETLPFSLQVTFAIGNALHWWCQNKPEMFGDVRYGHWKCLACHSITALQLPPKLNCKKCGADPGAFIYHEYEFAPKDLNFSGHIDMLHKRENGIIYPTEYKSLDGDEFEGLVAPLISHIWQVHGYMIGVEHTGLNASSETAFVIYFSKKNRMKVFPVKSFRVDRDEEIIEAIHEKIDIFTAGVKSKGKKLPPILPECSKNTSSWKVKQCGVGHICFDRG